MKKILASTLLVLFATSAFAAETAYVLQPLAFGQNSEYVEPCHQDAPVPANGLCGDGRECPFGYEPARKYCWDGGLKDCGMTCKNTHMYDN